MISLKDKVALVTGASKGIGRACALQLAERGAKLIINFRHSGERADEVVQMIQNKGGEVLTVQADVSQKRDCQKLVTQTLERFGQIDILINNAGVHVESSIDEVDEGGWNRVMDTNAKGIYMLSVLAGKSMREQGRGVIINIGSVAGWFPRSVNTVYAVSKGAVWTLTRALAISLAPQVRVNSVAPGIIETDMTSLDDLERRNIVQESNLRKRIGQPADIAKTVAFLVSDDADWITGQTIIADGGSSLV